MEVNVLTTLFFQYCGQQPQTVTLLSGAGSNRKYYRLSADGVSVIGVLGTSLEENRAFIALSAHFRKQRLPVPTVISVSSDEMGYLQEDLGDISLFSLIEQAKKNQDISAEKALLKRTLSLLPDLQFRGAQGLDWRICYPQPLFDKRTVLWDLNYFKYCFLKPLVVDFQEDRLEDDFERFSSVLLQPAADTFLYRDFQSRNVMIKDGEPFFIDYQGGRKGPVYYDVASFLWQAKADFPDSLREELLDVYLESLRKYQPDTDAAVFREQLRYFVLFRILQVLGAYGFRGYMEKKQHFIDSIPYAINNLNKLLEKDFRIFPQLTDVLRRLGEERCFQLLSPVIGQGLMITIYSFAYKHGIPFDDSGHGGGYVFDCRAIHNPGRYEVYRALTGLDRPVIDFLEANGEITDFLKNVYDLADRHVSRYLERKFTRLIFCFGCTGGRHRSVYAAQHLAVYLSEKYPVTVVVEHREQGLKTVLKS
ncbi:MAG: phosphotransferase [Dysgonamonadaceae bacterium]|jgi:aminoglycoside/choline kinase family phosphotransferase|nr:phosphotransferase [Dysgonamonadaceae bacterium]